jgi:hypothetical protein
MTGDSWNNGIRVEGQPEPGAKDETGAGFVRVMPGFFDDVGAKIVSAPTHFGGRYGDDEKGSRD